MSREKCRVLIIDDHDDTAEMLKILLGEEEYKVTTAATMQEALLLAASEEFDLYVLDKRLPDGSGLELCAKLNQITPAAPCISTNGITTIEARFDAACAVSTGRSDGLSSGMARVG